jgi:hypothetical protein
MTTHDNDSVWVKARHIKSHGPDGDAILVVYKAPDGTTYLKFEEAAGSREYQIGVEDTAAIAALLSPEPHLHLVKED